MSKRDEREGERASTWQMRDVATIEPGLHFSEEAACGAAAIRLLRKFQLVQLQLSAVVVEARASSAILHGAAQATYEKTTQKKKARGLC